MSEKPVAGREMLEMILSEVSRAPPSQADAHTIKEPQEMVAKGLDKFSHVELYDAVQRIGDREPHCEVSTFIHALCNLNKHYMRPELLMNQSEQNGPRSDASTSG